LEPIPHLTAREIDLTVKTLIDEAHSRAKDILSRAVPDEGAKLRLEKETVAGRLSAACPRRDVGSKARG
jgi:ATP-dependent Zn protease